MKCLISIFILTMLGSAHFSHASAKASGTLHLTPINPRVVDASKRELNNIFTETDRLMLILKQPLLSTWKKDQYCADLEYLLRGAYFYFGNISWNDPEAGHFTVKIKRVQDVLQSQKEVLQQYKK